MNNKGFMKTIEAVLAAIMVITMFGFLSNKIYEPVIDERINPAPTIDSMIDMISYELKHDIKDCNLERVQYLIKELTPDEFRTKTIIEYVTQINISATGNISNARNVSFTYNFPTQVDQNSVRLYSSAHDYPLNVSWNWVKIPILLQNNNESRYDFAISINNLNLSHTNALNNTLTFFWKNKKTRIDLEGTTITNSYPIVNITVEIPEMKPYESGTGYLTFARGASSYNASFTNLTGNDFNITIMNDTYSRRADVYFTLPSLSGSETLYLSYLIGTESSNRYVPRESNYNNTGISFDIAWDNLKICEPLQMEQYPLKEYFSVQKPFHERKLTSTLNILVWYQWV